MAKFKILINKDSKKYSIVLDSENEFEAKKRVHNEGYSILSIQEIENLDDIGNIFIFEGSLNGEPRSGKIVGEDIFKAYSKLRKDLNYNVDLIFPKEDTDLDFNEKVKIIKQLEEEYSIFFDKSKQQEKLNQKNNSNEENFFLRKELEQTYSLINLVLEKLDNSIKDDYLGYKEKEKLNLIYNEIIKLKKTTNISKLREIGELALNKLGELELIALEKDKNSENKNLLKQTNSLLRKIGSKQQFLEKDKNVLYILKLFFLDFFKNFSFLLDLKKEKFEVDKESHFYIKNLLYLKKYESRLKQNNINIIKNFFKFCFFSKFREDLLLTRSVLKQNIYIFKAKKKGKNISYTFLKNGFSSLFNNIFRFFKYIQDIIFIFIFFYTSSFLLNINFLFFNGFDELNFIGIFYFLFLTIFYILISLSRSIYFLFFNFVFFAFIVIFTIVNF